MRPTQKPARHGSASHIRMSPSHRRHHEIHTHLVRSACSTCHDFREVFDLNVTFGSRIIQHSICQSRIYKSGRDHVESDSVFRVFISQCPVERHGSDSIHWVVLVTSGPLAPQLNACVKKAAYRCWSAKCSGMLACTFLSLLNGIGKEGRTTRLCQRCGSLLLTPYTKVGGI